jgi:hypothetical protein
MFAYRGWGAKQKGERQKVEGGEGQVANLAKYSERGMEGGYDTAWWNGKLLSVPMFKAVVRRSTAVGCCHKRRLKFPPPLKIRWSRDPSPSLSLSPLCGAK